MIKRIVNNKGGLHNRLSQTLRIVPFTLMETEEFLNSKKIQIDRYQIIQLFMVTGGIPYYLSQIERGESASIYIDRICFTKDGLLVREFNNLFQSLFNEKGKHIDLVKLLANHPGGLYREELMKKSEISSGGRFSESLAELEESGFISSYVPFGAVKKNRLFRLTDEFSFFYLKYMGQPVPPGKGTWLRISAKQSWKIWAGFSWERICMKHIDQIKSTLGISGVYSEYGCLNMKGSNGKKGSQIDIYIDRDDHCINICECKYHEGKFEISSKYSEELRAKLESFKESTGTKKTLLLTFLTIFGLKENKYSASMVQKSLIADSLFNELF